jgi:hypothetical protein
MLDSTYLLSAGTQRPAVAHSETIMSTLQGYVFVLAACNKPCLQVHPIGGCLRDREDYAAVTAAGL